ncbi:hypothetical protein CE91St46_27850 [Eubacteriales bacterium]|nr:hypothetical protein CE91St46_27850 [Eubacteriales bacterium]GKH64393.1 hypothetical protein CE91St47_28620 [Eubacteriales bacterium]
MPLPLSFAFGIPIQHHESKRRFCAAPLTGDFFRTCILILGGRISAKSKAPMSYADLF